LVDGTMTPNTVRGARAVGIGERSFHWPMEQLLGSTAF